MTHWGARIRQMGTFPVNLENVRVFAAEVGYRLFTEKACSRNFLSSIQPPGRLRSKRNNPLSEIVSASRRAPELETRAWFHDLRELVEAVAKLQPDVVAADVSMPLANGIEAMRQFEKRPHL